MAQLTLQEEQNISAKKKNAQLLASGYTETKRYVEYTSVSFFVVLLLLSLLRVSNVQLLSNSWIILCSCVLAMATADFTSGLFHWFADTWGTLDTPLVGGFIRSFREHHLEPTAITRHDLFETNGDNCMITLPILLLTTIRGVSGTDKTALFVHFYLVLLCVWVSLTNQIHKWSHTYRPPTVVVWMQQYGLILSKRDHAIHHRNPFDKHYCITHGWLNPLLAMIDFWRYFERVITYFTGAIPRQDDMLWTGITAKTS